MDLQMKEVQFTWALTSHFNPIWLFIRFSSHSLSLLLLLAPFCLIKSSFILHFELSVDIGDFYHFVISWKYHWFNLAITSIYKKLIYETLCSFVTSSQPKCQSHFPANFPPFDSRKSFQSAVCYLNRIKYTFLKEKKKKMRIR